MTGEETQELGLLAKLVIVLGILLIVAGVFWHGVTLQVLQRIWHDLINRPSGPISFRFILQPIMAAIVAIHDGRKDVRTGRSPYLSVLTSSRAESIRRLREGLTATARIILLGLAMDLIYQALVFKTFYPVEALLIALLLALVPYLLIRGPVARVIRWRRNAARNESR
jgi:hypothetical protein